jgi:hypothetical protein
MLKKNQPKVNEIHQREFEKVEALRDLKEQKLKERELQ